MTETKSAEIKSKKMNILDYLATLQDIAFPSGGVMALSGLPYQIVELRKDDKALRIEWSKSRIYIQPGRVVEKDKSAEYMPYENNPDFDSKLNLAEEIARKHSILLEEGYFSYGSWKGAFLVPGYISPWDKQKMYSMKIDEEIRVMNRLLSPAREYLEKLVLPAVIPKVESNVEKLLETANQ